MFRGKDARGNRWSHIELGRWGEGVAADYVRAHGGKLLYRNFRGPRGGELDLVLRDGQQLCFVEVKTRRKRATGRPMDAVTGEKQELIERGGRAWLRLLRDRDVMWRFDVVEVELVDGQPPMVTWVKNAF
ncbi:YraN family protein [Rubritalea marina]|uniref:YraN family protein n=1 Tax=Rubritalea marina TaxID=361055 RepID=UPI000369F018|nr:YraN family protein [Rubritalea marina]